MCCPMNENDEAEKKKAKKGKKDEGEKTFVHSLLKRDKSLGFRTERLSQYTNVTLEGALVLILTSVGLHGATKLRVSMVH